MERFIVVTWRAMNILACLLLIGFAAYEYLILVSCGWAEAGDLFTLLAFLCIPFLGCGYHVCRLSRPRVSDRVSSELPRKMRAFLFIPAELCVLVAAWPILFVTAMGFGERIYFYEDALGSNYALVIYRGEQEYLKTNGKYTDRLEDLFTVLPVLVCLSRHDQTRKSPP